ncbi:hypothetical protein FACS1894166_02820 [Bacilli bacterium]|nr:hypothetical protein FACS1894166_02820 [Bacilli bacterium]
MLNSNIKIDLHIHSAESKYKDGSIVEDSKIENLDSLLSKLNDNEISMFSITDHNRFDYKIYEKAVEKVNSNVYPKIKKCLPAIEFDVSFLGDDRCHIIAVFDDKDISKIKNISNAINETRKLESKDDFYSIKEFSEILHKISTSTILIAHQKNSILTSHNNGQTNLSDAVNNMEEFYRIIKFGYIDALEFGNNKSEAIVKDSLKEIGLENIPLISGSDCHT